MNYVFFDIECASVNKYSAKICAFGYVICDEQFNIIKKEDILINPKGNFHLTDRKGDKGIVLPYSYEEFKNYPPFPKVYPFIKSLLEDRENIILGHATLNDVKYLNLETKRFKLPSFTFSFSDSQIIYESYVGDFSHQFGLESIVSALGVEFTPHRAVDDAYATMRIVQAICNAKGCNYQQLASLFGITAGRIKNYNLFAPTSQGEKQYHKKLAEEKRKRSKIRTEFFNHISRKRMKKDGAFYGKIFSFSNEIEEDLSVSKRLADKIYAKGGRYSHHVTHTDYYVCNDSDNSQRSDNARRNEKIITTDIAGIEEILNATAR